MLFTAARRALLLPLIGVFSCRRFSIDDAAIGQGAEPVWSTQLSPDSACSEGSVGSLDQQQDSGQSTPQPRFWFWYSACRVPQVPVLKDPVGSKLLMFLCDAGEASTIGVGFSATHRFSGTPGKIVCDGWRRAGSGGGAN